jgi:hypothetical protein
VAQAAITVRVIRRGTRVDELLAHLARALGREEIRPDDRGLIVLRIEGRPPKAWEAVRDALDSTGSDWREWLYLAPRPAR